MDDFSRFWILYNQSFPEDERRSLFYQKLVMSSPSYNLMHLKDEGTYQGFFCTWDFPEFLYLEHFAVMPEFRCGGNGTRFMKELLEKTEKPVILEVERPESEITARRVGFYERLGFCLNYYDYIQPALVPGRKPLPLYIMSYPGSLEPDEYRACRDVLYDQVFSLSVAV